MNSFKTASSSLNSLSATQKQWLLYILLFLFILFFVLHAARKIATEKAKRDHEKAVCSAFLAKYHLGQAFPVGYHISVMDSSERSIHSKNHYHLSFPLWRYTTSKGTKDRRYSHNKLIWGTCDLWVDHLIIRCKDPMDMVSLVNLLRSHGCKIEFNPLEQKKLASQIRKHRIADNLYSIQSIFYQFESHPTDFEQFCASLFNCMGYTTHVTSRTHDGGFDILMEKDYTTYIVECKCFNPANPVGRPLLQKLVGANSIQHADTMVFITTSSFSSYAVEYAKSFQMWLIDGPQLLQLYRTCMHSNSCAYRPSMSDWSLTREDLRPYYPPDI